ncbi:MAG TPA: Holliday junction resolvase RuvX [Gammaproteobacteria bacterium]|jgi:putative Holliday junction resolvase|nr:Holliday junction resolvase RuvX [Gammaproteobacteria bacterium]
MKKNLSNILIGFDFGMKRIGVAVGQTVTKTARPLATIKAIQGIPEWDRLNKIIQKWQPDALVVGIPLNMDGTEQPLTANAKHFATLLETRYQMPVYGMDERLSTKDARERIFNEGGFKALQEGQVDSVAAQLILQNWLIQHKE